MDDELLDEQNIQIIPLEAVESGDNFRYCVWVVSDNQADFYNSVVSSFDSKLSETNNTVSNIYNLLSAPDTTNLDSQNALINEVKLMNDNMKILLFFLIVNFVWQFLRSWRRNNG